MRCPLIDRMIVDVVGDTLLVRREFIEVFRVRRYREFGDWYAVSLEDLPGPIRGYVEAYVVRPAERRVERMVREAERRERVRRARRLIELLFTR